MKKIVCILLSMMSLQAALPPLSQSVREINEILLDPTLYEKMGGAQPIKAILKVQGGYLISTEKYSLFAKVIYLNRAQPGPANFKLEFGDTALN